MDITKINRLVYVVDEDSITQLDLILKKISPECKYVIVFKNNTSYQIESLEELIRLSKSQTHLIESISIKFSSDKIRGRVSIGTIYSDAVILSADGDEDSIFALEKRIENWTSSIKRDWLYSIIAKRDFFLLFLFLGVLLSVVLNIFSAFSRYIYVSPTATQSLSTNSITTVISIYFFWLIALGYFLNKVRSYLFPLSTFAIGYGLKKHQRMLSIRQFILVSVIVAIVINVISAYITR